MQATLCFTRTAAVAGALAAPPPRRSPTRASTRFTTPKPSHRTPTLPRATPSLDTALLNAQEAEHRAVFLEEQARRVVRAAVASSSCPVFPCAFIAGDVVLLHILAMEGLLATDRVPVVAIDTFHLFDETHEFCKRLEQAYDFTARVFRPAGFESKAEFVKVHGSDLFLRDGDQYDRIAKIEPFQRAMQELRADVMLNGRRRDHGGERAFLEVADAGAKPSAPINVQPLAFWEYADCWRYIQTKTWKPTLCTLKATPPSGTHTPRCRCRGTSGLSMVGSGRAGFKTRGTRTAA